MISLSGLTVSSSDAVTLASSVVDGMVDGCYETDCWSACYGDAVVDECGTCGGDGLACNTALLSLGAFDSSGSVEVLYEFGSPVAGFQFDLTGLALSSASGGAAEAAGFTVHAGGNGTVVGFSFTGDTIESGSGLLTVISFSDITSGETCMSLGSGAITGPGGVDFSNTIIDSNCISHSVIVPAIITAQLLKMSVGFVMVAVQQKTLIAMAIA